MKKLNKNFNQILFAIVISFTLLVSAGCHQKRPSDPRINIIDLDLRNLISIDKLVTNLRSDGLRKIQIRGFNHSGNYMKLEYKAEWLNEMGMAIPSGMSIWTEFPAHKRSEFGFSLISPSRQAVDIRILIRRR